MFNPAARQYVMYMHVDDPGHTVTKVGVATSPTVCGGYTYRGSFQPQGNISLDITLFVDDDGAAYLLCEARAAGRLRLYRLSADFLSVASLVTVLDDFEAPAIFKAGGRYYILGSHRTGWRKGSRTFNSQTTFVLPVVGSKATTYVFMGDRWIPSSLGTSPYVWLPLTVKGTSVSLAWHDHWTIDAVAGTWHP